MELRYRSKDKAGTETSQLRDEKEVQDRQQHTDIEAQRNLEENLQQLESRKQELELQEEQMQAKLKKIVDTVVKRKEELIQVRKEQREMKDKLGNSRLVKLLQMVFVLVPTCYWLLLFYPCAEPAPIYICWSGFSVMMKFCSYKRMLFFKIQTQI